MMREARAALLGPDRFAALTKGATGAETSRTSWLICRAGRVLCALPIDAVVEIMRLLPIEPLAGAPEYVRGLSIIRGTPVPVVDLGLVVGKELGVSTRLVAIRVAGRIIALAAGEVIGITAIAGDAFGELPPLLQDAATDTITAIGARDGELLVFLRTGRLVPDDMLARLDEAGVPL
jgi:purine-binding chemotaxis protein CheW